jgi:hypothetical protein
VEPVRGIDADDPASLRSGRLNRRVGAWPRSCVQRVRLDPQKGAHNTVSALTFRALHHNRDVGDPLVLPGPWDAGSAQALVAGYPALATPSMGGCRLARLSGRRDPAR